MDEGLIGSEIALNSVNSLHKFTNLAKSDKCFNVNLLSAEETVHLNSALAPAMAVKSSIATGNDPVSPPKIYRKCNPLKLLFKENIS